jgi:benzil reductase ((S)-benzoin forming)
MPISQPVAIVTGAGSGIGRATALELSAAGVHVIAVGRRLSMLEETAAMAAAPVTCVSADVSCEDGRKAILGALGATARLKYLVHAAGVNSVTLLQTPGAAKVWDDTLAINLDALFHLSVLLAPNLRDGGRVLFVGSNSATKPRRGGAAYCVSRAAAFMLYRCLKLELADSGIVMTSAIPSPVNTDMVRAHMTADPAIFPDGAVYARQLAAGEMIEPETVGIFYRWLLTATDDARFGALEWNIQDAAHHPAWLGDKSLFS